MLIKDLAATWLERLKTRKRKPCKPATMKNFSSGIRNHVNPLIGEMEVETFQNKQLRDLAEALVAKGLVVCPVYSFTNQPPSFFPWAG